MIRYYEEPFPQPYRHLFSAILRSYDLSGFHIVLGSNGESGFHKQCQVRNMKITHIDIRYFLW